MALKLKVESRDYRLPQTLEVIRGNIVKYGNPLGLKGSEIGGWAKDLNLPRQGDVLFYIPVASINWSPTLRAW